MEVKVTKPYRENGLRLFSIRTGCCSLRGGSTLNHSKLTEGRTRGGFGGARLRWGLSLPGSAPASGSASGCTNSPPEEPTENPAETGDNTAPLGTGKGAAAPPAGTPNTRHQPKLSCFCVQTESGAKSSVWVELRLMFDLN